MRYLVINSTGYGLGNTVRGAIDAYRDAVRPGAQVDRWTVGIAPFEDHWIPVMGDDFVTAHGGEFTSFDLDLR